MKKNPNAKNLVRKQIFLHPRNIEQIDELITKRSFSSVGEVVRRALEEFYDSTIPPYTRERTTAGKIKKEKYESTKDIESMSDEDYATKVLGGKIYTSESGISFVIYSGMDSGANAMPVKNCKSVILLDDPGLPDFNRDQIAKKSLEDRIRDDRSYLKSQFGIIVSE